MPTTSGYATWISSAQTIGSWDSISTSSSAAPNVYTYATTTPWVTYSPTIMTGGDWSYDFNLTQEQLEELSKMFNRNPDQTELMKMLE